MTVRTGKRRKSYKSSTEYRRKVLGQHFLADNSIRDRIISACGSLGQKHVLEIGAGKGVLTRELANSAAQVTAIEIDSVLAGQLRVVFDNSPEITIVEEDASKFDFNNWAAACDPLIPLVVGNIPYAITNSLLFKLIASHRQLGEVVLMVQEEVARKICAPHGHKPYGMITVLASYRASVRYLFKVGRKSFSPPPNVDSAVINLDFNNHCKSLADNEDLFEALVRRLFLDRRKQVQKILRNDSRFSLSTSEIKKIESDTGLMLSSRPEQLSVEQFVLLSNNVGALKAED